MLAELHRQKRRDRAGPIGQFDSSLQAAILRDIVRPRNVHAPVSPVAGERERPSRARGTAAVRYRTGGSRSAPVAIGEPTAISRIEVKKSESSSERT
jgi:hypothetical protein